MGLGDQPYLSAYQGGDLIMSGVMATTTGDGLGVIPTSMNGQTSFVAPCNGQVIQIMVATEDATDDADLKMRIGEAPGAEAAGTNNSNLEPPINIMATGSAFIKNLSIDEAIMEHGQLFDVQSNGAGAAGSKAYVSVLFRPNWHMVEQGTTFHKFSPDNNIYAICGVIDDGEVGDDRFWPSVGDVEVVLMVLGTRDAGAAGQQNCDGKVGATSIINLNAKVPVGFSNGARIGAAGRYTTKENYIRLIFTAVPTATSRHPYTLLVRRV